MTDFSVFYEVLLKHFASFQLNQILADPSPLLVLNLTRLFSPCWIKVSSL